MLSPLTKVYEQDFYAWSIQQATLIRSGRWAELDIDHLAEELEGMARSEKRELVNRLVILLAHLLKWQHQASQRSASWRGTIREQRKRIRKLLKDNPSLKTETIMAEAIIDGYDLAITEAAIETMLEETIFPAECPYSLAELLDENFYPGVMNDE